MKRMILDIETLAVPEMLPPGMLVDVVQVGVVVLVDDKVVERREWCVQPNGVCEESTVRWAMALAVKRGRLPDWAVERAEGSAWKMRDVLLELILLWGDEEKACRELWSKGSFDADILRMHFGHEKMFCPWRYHEARDLRTLMKVTGVKGLPYEEVAHEALADAVAEAAELGVCLGRVLTTDGHG